MLLEGTNSDYNYKIQILNSTGKGLNKTDVTVSINGKSSVFVTDESGYITIPFKKLTASQKITVTNPANSELKTTFINVVSRFSGAKNVVMYYFDGSKFQVKVFGDDGKVVGKNKVMVIKLNKKTYKVKTNANGYAILKIPNTVKPGTYKLTATYKGQTIKTLLKSNKTLKLKRNTLLKSLPKNLSLRQPSKTARRLSRVKR